MLPGSAMQFRFAFGTRAYWAKPPDPALVKFQAAFSQRFCSPLRQYSHSPSAKLKGTQTFMPDFRFETPEPTRSTTPPISWPRVIGSGSFRPAQIQSPFQTCQSVRQIPEATTRTRTSSSSISGIEISLNSIGLRISST